MRQIRKGMQWYSGTKVHFKVNKYIGLNHTIETTAANVHDFTLAAELMHGQQTVDSADSGFQGIEMRDVMNGMAIGSRVAMRPGTRWTCRSPRRSAGCSDRDRHGSDSPES